MVLLFGRGRAVLVLLQPQASVAGGISWMDHDIWFTLPDHRAAQDGGLGLINGGLERSARQVTLRLCSDEWLQLVV